MSRQSTRPRGRGPFFAAELGYVAEQVPERMIDRLRRGLWHTLDRYDELKWRVRANEVGRSALGFLALLFLCSGAALGFVLAKAAAHQEGTLTPARAAASPAVDTVIRTVTLPKTNPATAKPSGGRPYKTSTITASSPSLPARTVAYTKTIMDVGTLTRTRTVTVTDIQPVTVTVIETVTKKGKP
jgi:hypothetical protein